ncbi:cyclophilin-like domain-containing protein [Schizophyllum amplum]|uniref:peptidylprolyl isomerase n=1 Tax=Schizophyllum amplum TaxID=97359 RepID=A0A550C2D4_9AGAR|nr:cyclophilin-like domain-containing protein [Auriculariopsis ampla]
MRFTHPSPLLLGRLIIDLDASPALAKTRTNFLALCTGEKGACKNAPNKRLHYKGCPIHRVAKSFVFQGGDSIYGGKFADEKQGLKNKAVKGSVAMANSGKNSNSSQFFVVMTDDAAKLDEALRQVRGLGTVKFDEEGLAQRTLDRIERSLPIWIGECGVL